MKKKILISILLIVIVISLIVGLCFNTNKNKNLEDGFIGSSWESGIEIINFGLDGEFSFHDNSGSPVGDFDMCSSYEFNKKNGKIKLRCDNFLVGLFSKIEVIDYDGKLLVLKINGEEKTFSKYVNYDEFFVGFWKNNNEEYLRIWADGKISYTKEITVAGDEFENNYSYYNDECDDYYKSDDGTYSVQCPIDSKLGDSYIYNVDSNSITVYGTNAEKEKVLKIIEMTKDMLKIELDDKVIEFLPIG